LIIITFKIITYSTVSIEKTSNNNLLKKLLDYIIITFATTISIYD